VFGDTKTWTQRRGAVNGRSPFARFRRHACGFLAASDAPVVPAAFAVGEMVGASGREVLTAIVAGYEVCSGSATRSTRLALRARLPPTATRHYGAAAAAGKLFGLSAEQIVSAFGVSGSQAAGSLQFLVNGAWNKRYQVGAAG